jgi:CRISPR-associated endonuclease/helicase Cas3
MTAAPSFGEFYSALHGGRSPFPWQVRLAEQVLRDGWPGLLDLPTGSGKTSALDVALYCLASAPATMPRRTILVVDRRIVVDQGADHARVLQRRLREADRGPMRWAADSLRALWNGSAEDAPFAVSVMRGGMPRDNDWARRPDQPVFGVSTIDQVGSRLLFRGYGVAPRSASIHAGLLGNDLLILLDEVHLAIPFAQTLHAIHQRYRPRVPGLPERFHVVQMSATPGTAPPDSVTFSIDDADRGDPTLGKRLAASKLARLVSIKVTGTDEQRKRLAVAERAVSEAIALQEAGANVVGLVVNRVDTARIALSLLERQRARTDALLVTGRMRPIDRDRVVGTQLLPRAGAGRDRGQDRKLVVVATQCIEAGADLDFDALVTECASIDALRQRFGRVDRRGELQRSASVVLGRSDEVAEGAADPIYGSALAATWAWLGKLATNGAVDFGIASFSAHGVSMDLIAPHLDAPVTLPAHLDAWAQTSPVPSTDPDVAPWLHGPRSNAADVQIVWRVGAEPTETNLEPLIQRLLACRPSALEAVTIPLAAGRRWLAGDPSSAIADVVAGDAEDSDAIVRRRRDERGRVPVAVRWNAEDSELVAADDIRPGDILVVDCQRGGLAADSFDPDVPGTVVDLGDLAQLRGRGLASLRLRSDALTAWGLSEQQTAAMPLVDPEETRLELRERVTDWLRGLPSQPPAGFIGTEPEWVAANKAWRAKRLRVEVVDNEAVVVAPVSRPDLLLLDPETSDALTEDEDSSFRQIEVTLKTHSSDVRDFAERFARAIGFSNELVEDLALSGWYHDVGKADPRFQRWLVGGSDVRASLLDEPLAKSALPPGNAADRRVARDRAGYPVGYRHELLSLAMIEQHTDALARAHDRELVLHLVASHHGWCRPFAPPLDHPDDLKVVLKHDGAELAATTRHGKSRLDSGVADRFWSLNERYGWWGLAWLEAVMRLADHRASEIEAEGPR